MSEVVTFLVAKDKKGRYNVDIDGEIVQFEVMESQPAEAENKPELKPTPSSGGLSCAPSLEVQTPGLEDFSPLLGVLFLLGLLRFSRR